MSTKNSGIFHGPAPNSSCSEYDRSRLAFIDLVSLREPGRYQSTTIKPSLPPDTSLPNSTGHIPRPNSFDNGQWQSSILPRSVDNSVTQLRTVPNESQSPTTIILPSEPRISPDEGYSSTTISTATWTGNPTSAITNSPGSELLSSPPQRPLLLLKKLRDAFKASRGLQAEDNALQLAETQLKAAQKDFESNLRYFEHSPTEPNAGESAVSDAKALVEWRRTKLTRTCTSQEQAIQELGSELSKSRATNHQLETEVATLKENFTRFKEDTALQITALFDSNDQTKTHLRDHDENTDKHYRQLKDKIEGGKSAIHVLSNKVNEALERGVACQGQGMYSTYASTRESARSGPLDSLVNRRLADTANSSVAIHCSCATDGTRNLLCKAQYPLPEHGELQNLWAWVRFLEYERKRICDVAASGNQQHLVSPAPEAEFSAKTATTLDAPSQNVPTLLEHLRADGGAAMNSRLDDLSVCIKHIEKRLEASEDTTSAMKEENTSRTDSLDSWVQNLEHRLEMAAGESQNTWKDQAKWIGKQLSDAKQKDASEKSKITGDLSSLLSRHSTLCHNVMRQLKDLKDGKASKQYVDAKFQQLMASGLELHPAIVEFRDYMKENSDTADQFDSLKETLTKLKNHVNTAEKTYTEEMRAMKKATKDLRQESMDKITEISSAIEAADSQTLDPKFYVATTAKQLQIQNQYLQALILQTGPTQASLNQLTDRSDVQDESHALNSATETLASKWEVPSSNNSDHDEIPIQKTKSSGSRASSPLSIHSDDEFSAYENDSNDSDRSRSSSPSSGPGPGPSLLTAINKGKRKATTSNYDSSPESTIIIGPNGFTKMGSSSNSKRPRVEKSSSPEIHAFFADKSKWTNKKARNQ